MAMGRLQTDVESKDSRAVRGYPDVIHTLFILGTDDIHTVQGVARRHAYGAVELPPLTQTKNTTQKPRNPNCDVSSIWGSVV